MPISRKKRTVQRLAKLQTKKKISQKRKQKGGASAEEIKKFIEETLTTERTVKDKVITPVPWVWDLLSENNFFNNTYVPALAGMKDYKKKNTIHREFENVQKKKKDFYLMNNPEDKNAKSLIATKKESFYDKSPQELYDWWLSKQTYMDSNSIETVSAYPLNDTETGTDTIISVIIPCIINCMTHILNSYIKYGEKEGNKKDNEIKALTNVLTNLLELFKDESKYATLYEFIISFANWYDIRVNETQQLIISNLKVLQTGKLFYLPMSTGLNYCKTIYMYSAPILYFSIVNEIGHGTLYTPYANMRHDMLHAKDIINVFNYIKTKENIDYLKKIYSASCAFFTKIYNKLNDNKETNKDLQHLCYVLFSYLHENALLHCYDDKKNEKMKDPIVRSLTEWFNDRRVSRLPTLSFLHLIRNIGFIVEDTDHKQLYDKENTSSSFVDFVIHQNKNNNDRAKHTISVNTAHTNFISFADYDRCNKFIKECIDEIFTEEIINAILNISEYLNIT